MPVTTAHTDYVLYSPLWQKLRDCDAGEQAIHDGGTRYLPALNGQKSADYQVYVQRAPFYEAFGRTIDGLHGAIFRKPTVVELQGDDALLELLEDASLEGVSFTQQIKFVVREILGPGRHGLLVDFDPQRNRPKIVAYDAEHIRNWPDRLEARIPLTRPIVLFEQVEQPGSDEFAPEIVPQYRVLDLDGQGLYRQRVFRQVGLSSDWVQVEEILPDRRGVRFDFIPFLFVGVTDLTPHIEKPPLLGLANENLHHYRIAADFESKHHWSAVVQPYVMTMKEEDVYYFGSSVAWILNPGDTAGMLETSGAALGESLAFLDRIEGRMAKLGAELLEEPKQGVEAAETVRLRQSGRSSVLGNIADTASRTFTQALRWFAWWAGATEEVNDADFFVKINNEFQEAKMDPAERNQLMLEWQARGVSTQTYRENLKRGGVIPEERTVEEEEELIAAQPAFAPEDLDADEPEDKKEEEDKEAA